MSDHSVDASFSQLGGGQGAVSPAALSGGGNPRISAPLQNTSLGSGKVLGGLDFVLVIYFLMFCINLKF